MLNAKKTCRLNTSDSPEPHKPLAGQTAALENAEHALLWTVSTGDQKRTELKLDAVPDFYGMAAAGGRLFMAIVGRYAVSLGQWSLAAGTDDETRAVQCLSVK